MGPNELDAEEGPELRALREREQRGGRLSEAERRRFAELLDDQIKAVVTAGRLAASASVAEVDQLLATTRDMAVRLEAMGEAGDLDGLMGVSPVTTAQLASDLLRAAEHVVFYGGWGWDHPQFAVVDERLGEAFQTFGRRLEELEQLMAREEERKQQIAAERRQM